MAENCGDCGNINFIVDDPYPWEDLVIDGRVKLYQFFKKESLPKMIKLLMKLNTYICINRNNNQNVNYLKLIKDALMEWNRVLAKERREIVPIFKIKFLCLECKLPKEISSVGCRIALHIISKNLTVENIKSLLSSDISSLHNQLRHILCYQGPWLKVRMEHTNSDAICSEMNLLSSSTRQHFERMSIHNVQVRKHSGENIIEIRPCSLKQCLELLKCNVFHQCLKEYNIKTFDTDSILETLKYLCPTISKCERKLEKLIQKGAHEELTELVQKCMAEEKVSSYEQNGETNTLLQLFKDSQPGLFKMLLEATQDLFKTEQQIYNLLHLAVMHDRQNVIKMIFYAGLWPKLRSGVVECSSSEYNGYTPRRIAEDLSKSSVLMTFDYYDECYSKLPPLHKACLHGSLLCASNLIGPHNIHKKDEVNEATCLTYAAASGNKVLVKYLLEKGANPGIKDKMGNTPLDNAKTFCNEEIVDILCEKNDQ